MADIVITPPQQRQIADMRSRGLRDEEIIAILAGLQRREASLDQRDFVEQRPPRAHNNNMPWIVGGFLFALAMVITACWSAFVHVMDMMERSAERSHELAMEMASSRPVSPGVEQLLNSETGLLLGIVVVVLGCLIAAIIK